MSGAAKTIKTIWFSIFASAGLVVVKGTAGIFGNSYALVADAIESTADILSSLLVLIGVRYANRPADAEHPYGHGRAEPLFTFMVVGFLVGSAVLIGYESILHITTPHAPPEAWTLYVLAPIIVWKEVSFRLVMRRARETGSTALKADAWHHRSDALTSVAAFIGIGVALLMGPGYEAADDWAALLAAGFIFYNSYNIVRPALGEIMDEQMHPEMVLRIRTVAIGVPGIRGTEKCLLRKAGSYYHVDLHAMVDADISVREGHALAHALKDELQRSIPELASVLIHIEPFE